MLPFVLWALGVIPAYGPALGAAVALGLAAAAWALANEIRLARRAGDPQPT
ncbi:MAG: hypothetical protein P8129_15400 [Anaerolineae bacterium]